MELETILLAAIQSSFLLGLLHGVNPCGHSWLVLFPFITGEKNGARVALLTGMFVSGTAVACLILGATLGAASLFIPASMSLWVDGGTSIVLLVIGILLLVNPHILHNHDHDAHHNNHANDHHHHDHDKDHTHSLKRPNLSTKFNGLFKNRKILPLTLFSIGFVNMIIPCPTAAVMYGYALSSGSVTTATIVFGTYALSTAIAVGCVIFFIFKVSNMASSIQKEWVEPLIMRAAGAIILFFSAYGLYQTVLAFQQSAIQGR